MYIRVSRLFYVWNETLNCVQELPMCTYFDGAFKKMEPNINSLAEQMLAKDNVNDPALVAYYISQYGPAV
jgi:hypothetical protein